MNPKTLGLPLLLLGLVACESVDSTAVTTAGVYADITAMADGSGSTRTTAILKVGGATSNTYLDLIKALALLFHETALQLGPLATKHKHSTQLQHASQHNTTAPLLPYWPRL